MKYLHFNINDNTEKKQNTNHQRLNISKYTYIHDIVSLQSYKMNKMYLLTKASHYKLELPCFTVYLQH